MINDIQDLLLYCIHIAEHKGVFYTQPEFDKARTYVKNQLNKEELEIVIDELEYSELEFTNDYQYMIDKLKQQKDLFE